MPNECLVSAHHARGDRRLPRLPVHGTPGLARDRLRAARLPALRDQRRAADPGLSRRNPSMAPDRRKGVMSDD
jgi:hypothetical protein